MVKNKPACDCAKMENFKEKQPETEKEGQIIEGAIGEYQKNYQEQIAARHQAGNDGFIFRKR